MQRGQRGCKVAVARPGDGVAALIPDHRLPLPVGLVPGEMGRRDMICIEAIYKSANLPPHPLVAKYKGTGDTNDAANFMCAKG